MKIQVSETMNKSVLTIDPGVAIAEAYAYLRECRVRHLVVVDEKRHVVGVISDRDFQRAMQTRIENTGSGKSMGEFFISSHQVQDYMSCEIQFIHESAGLRQVAMKMLETKISSLVVVDDRNKMVGFITTDDLLWVLVKLTEEDKKDEFLGDLKAKIMNSPLGTIINSVSQAGI